MNKVTSDTLEYAAMRLNNLAKTSRFFASLLAQYRRTGTLSTKQAQLVMTAGNVRTQRFDASKFKY